MSEQREDDATERLRLGSMIDATEAEGPGLRFVLWAQGCSLGCEDCCNPHLWSARGGEEREVADVLELVLAARARRPALEGITLVGGEPFEQDAPLAALCAQVRADGLSVMAFSGYTLEELRARGSRLLAHVDLLVDGRYLPALHTTAIRWVGSSNQRLHFLSDAYRPDDPRFAEPNHAELRLDHRGELQVVGFPFPRVREAFGPGSALARAERQAARQVGGRALPRAPEAPE
ncbi:MAG: 4Fe-4S single cluster domain-containing protein [Planctomycetota bacterium]